MDSLDLMIWDFFCLIHSLMDQMKDMHSNGWNEGYAVFVGDYHFVLTLQILGIR